jgi:hypothetical protein
MNDIVWFSWLPHLQSQISYLQVGIGEIGIFDKEMVGIMVLKTSDLKGGLMKIAQSQLSQEQKCSKNMLRFNTFDFQMEAIKHVLLNVKVRNYFWVPSTCVRTTR